MKPGEHAMRTRRLGKNGFEVSVLAMGAWQLADERYWGRGGDPERAVKTAIDCGITLFDTAEMYADGESEKVLGRALGRDRDRVRIASKAVSAHCAPAALRAACEASLKRLRTDRIDLYQVHWPARDVPFADTAAEMRRLQQEGKILAAGVSNFGPQDLESWMAAGAAVSNQVGYNLLFRAPEYEILPACRRYDLSLLAYMPLLQGILTGRWTTVEEIPPARRRIRHFAATREGTQHGEPGCESELFAALRGIRAVADRLGCPMADVAIGWLLARPEVTAVLVGARDPDQVRRNARAAALVLDAETVAELDAVTAPVKEALGPNADMWDGAANSRIR